ncbi:hypothetical protein BH10BAC1_BH10BAC1_01600 [soil metagenome]
MFIMTVIASKAWQSCPKEAGCLMQPIPSNSHLQRKPETLLKYSLRIKLIKNELFNYSK